MFLAVSDMVWIALIGAASPIVLALIGLLVNSKLNDIAKTGQAVHVLVNSSMSTQLRVSKVALQRVAELTNNPADIEAALLAEHLFEEHERKQRIVDNAPGAPPK